MTQLNTSHKTTGILKEDKQLSCYEVRMLGIFGGDVEVNIYDGEDATGLLVFTNEYETTKSTGMIPLNIEVGGKLWAEITTALTAATSGAVLYYR